MMLFSYERIRSSARDLIGFFKVGKDMVNPHPVGNGNDNILIQFALFFKYIFYDREGLFGNGFLFAFIGIPDGMIEAFCHFMLGKASHIPLP